MKLSEALSLRKDAQKRIEQLRERATNNAVVQEGEAAVEDPNALIEETRSIIETWQQLVRQINLTNAVTRLDDGTLLTVAIAQRDALKMQRAVLTQVADAATPGDTRHRFSPRAVRRALRSELRDVPQVNVGDLRRQADELARRIRELDQRIQLANFTVDLIES